MSSFWIWHRRFPVLTSNFLVLTSKFFQRRQTRSFKIAPAVARAAIQVRPAHRAEAFAVPTAERLHWQREIALFAHQLFEIDLVVLVERGRAVVLFNLHLDIVSRAGVGRM